MTTTTMFKHRGIFLLAQMILLVECVQAQIQIIPRQRIDSLNNIATLTSSPMHFLQGERVSLDTIAEDQGPWQCVVEWINESDKPIVVNQIRSSCGCLRAQSNKRVVRSGERASIKIEYFPKGHPGRVSQRLFIYTSVEERNPTSVLHLSGYVEASTDRQDDYPMSRGGLRLRQDEVQLSGDGIYRVACYNATDAQLQLSADTLLSARGVRMYTEPKVLQPGAEGDLIIECDERVVKSGDRLYIKGLSLPPRERAIMLK